MAKIIGIGGVFIYAQNTELLAAWYERYLGFSFERMGEEGQAATYYQVLSHRDLDHPDIKLHTVFSIMPALQNLGESRNQVMVNYRVDDIDEFVEQLSSAGVEVDPIETWDDGEGKGKFTHFHDPEGNKIELWQHIAE